MSQMPLNKAFGFSRTIYSVYNERFQTKGNDMKRTQKIKNWIVKHEEGVAIAAVCTVYAAFVGGIIYLAKKSQEEMDRAEEELQQALVERQQNIVDAINRGDQILPNLDGTYWIIHRDTKELEKEDA